MLRPFPDFRVSDCLQPNLLNLPRRPGLPSLPAFCSRGLFAGSGVVESGCKAVPGSRRTAAQEYYEHAIALARSPAERVSFQRRIESLEIS